MYKHNFVLSKKKMFSMCRRGAMEAGESLSQLPPEASVFVNVQIFRMLAQQQMTLWYGQRVPVP